MNQYKNFNVGSTSIATVDFRSILDPPTRNTYFNNYVGRIAEMVEELNRGVMVGAKEMLAKVLFPQSYQFVVGVAGSPRLGMYGVDFRYGRPRKVEIASDGKDGARGGDWEEEEFDQREFRGIQKFCFFN
ncbi:Phenolic glucoside malonyltransferase 1 [Linum perenne]